MFCTVVFHYKHVKDITQLHCQRIENKQKHGCCLHGEGLTNISRICFSIKEQIISHKLNIYCSFRQACLLNNVGVSLCFVYFLLQVM